MTTEPKYGPLTTAIYGTQDVAAFFEKAAAAVEVKNPAYEIEPVAWCKCDHIDAIHADMGTGACGGEYTEYDFPAEPGPCPCQRFEAS